MPTPRRPPDRAGSCSATKPPGCRAGQAIPSPWRASAAGPNRRCITHRRQHGLRSKAFRPRAVDPCRGRARASSIQRDRCLRGARRWPWRAQLGPVGLERPRPREPRGGQGRSIAPRCRPPDVRGARLRVVAGRMRCRDISAMNVGEASRFLVVLRPAQSGRSRRSLRCRWGATHVTPSTGHAAGT